MMGRKKRRVVANKVTPPKDWIRPSLAVIVVFAVAIALGRLLSVQSPTTAPDAAANQLSSPSLADASIDQLEALLKIPQVQSSNSTAALVDDVERWRVFTEKSLASLKSELPNDAQAEHLYGVALMRLKRTQQAEPSLKRAIELAPSDQQMRLDLAELLMQLGRDQEALATLEAQTIPLGTDQWLERLAACQERAGQIEKASATLSQLVTQDSKNWDAWIKLGKLHLQQTSPAEAERCARQAIELNGRALEAWQLLARSLALQKRSDESKQALKQWQLLTSQSATTDTRDASFESRYSLDTVNVLSSILRSLGKLYQSKNKIPLAETMYARALELNENDTIALAAWSSLLRRAGEFERAREFQRRLISLQPHEPAHYQNLANLSMELQRPEDAEAVLRLARLKMPQDEETRLLLARFLEMINKHDEASLELSDTEGAGK